MKRVVILQSNYLPWKGYFDLINDAELFIFHDDLQYTKNDWRNRNKIKGLNGLEWLTVPAGTDEHRLICEVELKDATWQRKHWGKIFDSYRAAPYFKRYQSFFEDFFLGRPWSNLSELNQTLIRHIAKEFLGVKTSFGDSREYALTCRKQDRVLELLGKVGAKCYISGPAAKSYIEAERFEAAGIELAWKDYSGYPEYPQRFPPFEHGVSILDLIFCVGPDAPWYIWGWREGSLSS